MIHKNISFLYAVRIWRTFWRILHLFLKGPLTCSETCVNEVRLPPLNTLSTDTEVGAQTEFRQSWLIHNKDHCNNAISKHQVELDQSAVHAVNAILSLHQSSDIVNLVSGNLRYQKMCCKDHKVTHLLTGLQETIR